MFLNQKSEITSSKLENWLRTKFYRDNHPKYRHYFDEWYSKLLPHQLKGFEKQMFNDENNILRHCSTKL